MSRSADRPAAIIDIGSNSVRLVIFQKLERVPRELHTEQIYPHLGRNIGKTGRLDATGKRLCLDGLRRYAALCDAYQVGERLVVATAAIREAADGAEFAAAIHDATGLKVAILSGAEEGRLSALGVLSGIPRAEGLVGDIGGGSLELALISNGTVGERTTLSLGPFRLQRYGDHRDRRNELIRLIDAQFDSVPWLAKARGKSFYAVGGNWRAIAKVQIKRDQHPLDIVHQHELTARQGIEIAEFLSTLSPPSLERFSVARKRAALVPYAALALERVLRAAKPRALVFSGYGLREGIVFNRLSPREKALDPLYEACRHVDGSESASEILARWTDDLFSGDTVGETRLRHAVCLLAGSGSQDNPVHRAQSAWERALYLRSGDLDHEARAFMAYALYVRYEGSLDNKTGKAIRETAAHLMGPPGIRRATRLGKILNFAETVSAGSAPLLNTLALRATRTELRLEYDPSAERLVSETVRSRFDALAKDLHLTAVLRQTGSDMRRENL